MSISSDKKKHNAQKIKTHQFSENEVHFKNVHVKSSEKKIHITQKYCNESQRPQ